jgi:hypothetical protein
LCKNENEFTTPWQVVSFAAATAIVIHQIQLLAGTAKRKKNLHHLSSLHSLFRHCVSCVVMLPYHCHSQRGEVTRKHKYHPAIHYHQREGMQPFEANHF